MNPNKPLLSSSLKLGLTNSALFALSFAALLLLVTWLADRFMQGHVSESVSAELHILEAEYQLDGARGVSSLIFQRLRSINSDNHFRLYRLENAEGQSLGGNWDQPINPATSGSFFYLPSIKYPGKTRIVTQSLNLSDGARLLVGFDEIEIQQVRNDIRRAAMWSLLATILLSLAAGFFLTRNALRPVDIINQSARRIMAGELSHRFPTRNSNDELDRLSQTLNQMLDRIEQLMTAVKGATDNIAHDLRSPLTRHRARLEAAKRTPPPESERHIWIEKMLADVDQVLATFQSLLRIAQVESGSLRRDFTIFDLNDVVSDVIGFMEPLAESRQQVLDYLPGSTMMITAHRNLVFQAVLNLLDNAIKYSPESTTIHIRIEKILHTAQIHVRDAGPGIPPEARNRVFERLYRLDRARQTPGLGLGLSLVQSVAKLHHGEISIHDANPGCIVTLCLPLSP